MEVDDFQSSTEAFLSWLSAIGVRMSPKMALKDLRSESRGRGVGKSSSFVFNTLPSHNDHGVFSTSIDEAITCAFECYGWHALPLVLADCDLQWPLPILNRTRLSSASHALQS